jgi:hypothetical protein
MFLGCFAISLVKLFAGDFCCSVWFFWCPFWGLKENELKETGRYVPFLSETIS